MKSMYLLQKPHMAVYSLQACHGNKVCYKWKPNAVIFEFIQFSYKEPLLVNMENNSSM